MKIVKLKGGLGNQMFQYAFAKLLEQETKEKVVLDFSAYTSLKDDVVRVPRIMRFALSLHSATQEDIDSICAFQHKGNSQTFLYRLGIFVEKTFNKKYFWESSRAYIDYDTLLKYSFYDGYWQSYRYVEPILASIRREFVPKGELSEKTLHTMNVMRGQEAVFVGVRRGDYAAEAEHYGSFSEKYYLTAMEMIERTVDNPVFYIFSNDIEWCKSNIQWGNRHIVFREKEDQTDDFEELMLMNSCKHAIIVNSTFNWWGAYLIDNPNKIVICPQKWFFDDKPIDIIPPEWVRIEEK